MKNLIFYLSYLCFCIPIFGQYQITVVRPQELSLRSIHIWNCIINNEQKIPILCYLHGTVTEAKDGKLGEARSADFLLNTGITQFNSTNYDALRPEQVIQSNKKYEEHVIRTNSLPNGNYTVCLTLIETQTKKQLANNCLKIVINNVTPPTLLSPTNGSKICEPSPVFLWNPFRGSIESNLTYRLHIVEVLTNQKPITAIKTNPCFFCTSGITEPLYQYSMTGVPFRNNQTYAWYIGVQGQKKEIAVSPVWSFTWNECNGVSEEGVEEEEEGTLVETSNDKKKGLNYFFVSAFNNQSDNISIDSKQLNFYIDNKFNSEKMEYSISNGKTSLFKQVSDINQGFNYFTIPLHTIKLTPEKKYKLRILFDNAEELYLNFKLNNPSK